MAKKKVHASRKSSGKPSKKKHSKTAGKTRSRAGVKPKATATEKKIAIDHVQWVHATLDKIIDGFPADKVTYQVAGTDNHVMWTIGHLATAYSWFASLIDGKKADLPESYEKLFGYQSKPTGDAAAYPSLEEVKKHCRAAYARFIDAASSQSEADFVKPTVSDSHGFASSRQDVVLKTAWHDAWHSGQLSSLRRALGMPPLM